MLANPQRTRKELLATRGAQIELTAEDFWQDVSARLRQALNDTTYSTWFGEVEGAKIDGDTFVVAVPNDFTREWIEGHFLDLVRATVRDAGGSERQRPIPGGRARRAEAQRRHRLPP